MQMTDSLSVDTLMPTQVVHGDALIVPAGQACPLDGDRILRAGDASMLSYHGVTDTYGLRVSL